jgi:5-methylcytosine-specific restriction endonuclease McrA
VASPDPYASTFYRQVRPLVLARAGGRCEWPGCTAWATSVDHVIPLAYGGTHHPDNLRASCRKCNSQGGVKITNEMRRARKIGRRSRRW